MTFMGLLSFLGTQTKNLGTLKNLSMEIIKEDLREEALRLKEQTQPLQGHLVVDITRDSSRQLKR
jgi:hypothetical protein